jgi:cytochrome c
MVMKLRLIYAGIFVGLLLYAIVNFASPSHKIKILQDNQPPVVKIIAPKNNSLFDSETQVNYTISVSDKEDGESKFDEINTKEVLLEVRYTGNKSKMPPGLNNRVQNDPPGLAVMRTSNCFNCHNFNAKSIGPSFYEINKRYPATPANVDSIIKRIRMGSSGIWGKEKMPTHPELTVAETKNTVQWILKYAAASDVNYYIGTEGTFRIKPPLASKSKGDYILTASYTDHGLKNTPGTRLKGQDIVIIHSR